MLLSALALVFAAVGLPQDSADLRERFSEATGRVLLELEEREAVAPALRDAVVAASGLDARLVGGAAALVLEVERQVARRVREDEEADPGREERVQGR